MTDSVVGTTAGRVSGAPQYPMVRPTACPFDPPTQLQEMQKDAPISRVTLWDGSTPWMVTRHEDFRALLGDPRVSADYSSAGFPHVSEGAKVRFQHARTFLNMDAPDHTRFRRMVAAPFAVKRVEAMRPAIQRITDDLIDAMLAGPNPADLVEAFALPLPSLVISDLLGVPYDDHEFFQRTTATMVSRDSTPERIVSAIDELTAFLDDLLLKKRASPADDVLSELVLKRVDTGEISHHQAAELGVLLLVAGHETTANMITLATIALLQNPDQLAELRTSDDPKLVAGTVEEMLRYTTILQWGRRRVAKEDIEIGGQVIRAGEGIIASADMANRDPEIFDDPYSLDIHRDARRHVAFGYGMHQCLGQPLARIELQAVYSTLYRRIPTLRLAEPVESLPFKNDGVIYGVYELPVTW